MLLGLQRTESDVTNRMLAFGFRLNRCCADISRSLLKFAISSWESQFYKWIGSSLPLFLFVLRLPFLVYLKPFICLLRFSHVFKVDQRQLRRLAFHTLLQSNCDFNIRWGDHGFLLVGNLRFYIQTDLLWWTIEFDRWGASQKWRHPVIARPRCCLGTVCWNVFYLNFTVRTLLIISTRHSI